MRGDKDLGTAPVVSLEAGELLGFSQAAKVLGADGGLSIASLGRLLSKRGGGETTIQIGKLLSKVSGELPPSAK